MEYNIPTFEITIDDNYKLGVDAVALVENPAIEIDWIALKAQTEIKLASIDDKQMLYGPALIPDKQIYRRDSHGNEYYIVFSKDTIAKIVDRYFKQANHINFNLEHNDNLTVPATVNESWIVKDPEKDQSALYGFALPVGTWMLGVHVDDQQYWNEFVKTGKVKGFSIEGDFGQQLIEMNKVVLVEPKKGEHEADYISRCIAYHVGQEGMDSSQAAAICHSKWDAHLSAETTGDTCPIATQDIPTNLKNRQVAIDNAHYGPLDPNLPNDEYWAAKAKMFNDSPENARKATCSNCAFFNISKKIEDCIAKAIGNEGGDPYAVLDAGKIGYCEAWDFKCAGARTCDAWVAGGPVTMFEQLASGEKISFDFDGTLNTPLGKQMADHYIKNGTAVYIISARSDASSMYSVADALGIPHSRVYATGSNIDKVTKIKQLGIDKHYDNNMNVVKMLPKIGVSFSLTEKEALTLIEAILLSKYEYPVGDFLSGFSEDMKAPCEYEIACQDMVIRGVEYFEAHPELHELISKGGVTAFDKVVEPLINYMCEGLGEGATGAMVEHTTMHAYYAYKMGWDNYIKEITSYELSKLKQNSSPSKLELKALSLLNKTK